MNIFKNKGFKEFIFRIILFLAITILLVAFAVIFFNNSKFYLDNINAPKEYVAASIDFNYTYIINALIFGIVSFILISHKKLLKIKSFQFQKSQIIFMITTIITIFAYYFFDYLIRQHTPFFLSTPIVWNIIELIIVLSIGISLALAVFGLKFAKYFFKQYKNNILLIGTLTIIFYFIIYLVQNLWTYFSGLTSDILYWVFTLFFDKVTYIPYGASFTANEIGGPLLGINSFNAIIGKPCAGIDSLLLFTSVFLLIVILDYKKLNKIRTIIAFIIGLIGMFFINILRIFLLFIVGSYINPKLAIGLFHTNIGWILFIIYGLLFYYISFKYIYRTPDSHK